MTTATAIISPAATMFLLSSYHPDHRGPSLTPPPQSPEEEVAEVEAEVEQFRRQLYLKRGLSYPGPKTTTALPRQGATDVARQQYSSDRLPGKMVGLSQVATGAVITGTTTTVASTAGVVEFKTESSSPSSPPLLSLSPSPSSSSSSSSSSPSPSLSSSSITTTPTPASSGSSSSGDNNTRLPKTFSQLMEDLIRTHSSTASPSGQKYSNDLLQGTIGRCEDAVFGSGTYFGSFT